MSNHKGITLVTLIITIIVLVILAGIGIDLIMEKNMKYVNETNIEEYCNHEFVITSKYDWYRESYKTISKCTKCEKEI